MWSGRSSGAIAGSKRSDAMTPFGVERMAGEAKATGVEASRHIVQWPASCGFGAGLSAFQLLRKWSSPSSDSGDTETEQMVLPCGPDAAPHSSEHSACEHVA